MRSDACQMGWDRRFASPAGRGCCLDVRGLIARSLLAVSLAAPRCAHDGPGHRREGLANLGRPDCQRAWCFDGVTRVVGWPGWVGRVF
jgi:hypothetical protein